MATTSLKIRIQKLMFLSALITNPGLMHLSQCPAQSFTTLHSFTRGTTNSLGVSTNGDGQSPFEGLILSSNILYGTAKFGGSWGNGTIFKIRTDGTGFTNLHSFTALSANPPYTNSDGGWPEAPLILSGNTLYGTATAGGSTQNGTIFKVDIDGKSFTTLHKFTGSDGGLPSAELILAGNTLYGTAYRGGTDNGTVFKINTNGSGFMTLYTFTAGSGSFPNITNNDGANPNAGLILSGNTLYGTAYRGGTSAAGAVFAIKTNGTGFTNIHSFTSLIPYYTNFGTVYSTNKDGANPKSVLVLEGGTLYGTASAGGRVGNGAIFALNTNGTGFTNLHNFTSGNAGVIPHTGLILSSNMLYGTTQAGGSGSAGNIFAVNTNGTGFTNLYSFFGSSDGTDPRGRLILSESRLYGTARSGGSAGVGTLFYLSLAPPQLKLVRSATNIVLTWPANVTFNNPEFTLQSTTNLISPAVWSTVSPGPTKVNGQNTVTNSISGKQKFFRLSR